MLHIEMTLDQAELTLKHLESACAALHNHIASAVEANPTKPYVKYHTQTAGEYARELVGKLRQTEDTATVMRGAILRAQNIL